MSSATSFPFSNYLLIFATFVLLTASVWHWLKNGGFGGKILSTLTMLFLAYIFFYFVFNIHRYGDRVLEVKASETRKNAELAIKRPADDQSINEWVAGILSALRGSSPRENPDEWKSSNFTPQTSHTEEVNYTHAIDEYPITKVVLTEQPSDAVIIPEGRCIATWQVDHDTLSYTTEAIPVGSNEWIIFTGGPRIKQMRWYGEGTMAYQLRKDGSC